jgi:hypothetical protein
VAILIAGLREVMEGEVMRRTVVIPIVAAVLSVSAAGLSGHAGPVGAGAAPTTARVSVFPSTVSFGTRRVGSVQSQSVTVQNTGDATLHVRWVNLSDFSGSYSLAFNSCAGATVPPGQSCQFSIEFRPRTTGQHSANATIYDDAPGGNRSVFVWGNAD